MKPSGHNSREIISIIEADGWALKNVEGSHYQFKHPTKKGKVTITHPDKDVPAKTFRAIMKQAGL
ncbi:MAG: type II toxin-antitoxin system HicA family toxin [Synergistaceae bacterium]|jgi:predicted RNA binding protein YcfA (HicA-like mRNA interferase family)|nr:type II toxin-antitoxin system HicA family toxin [Synergistaceae bacterium]